jgi:hypothetical protein
MSMIKAGMLDSLLKTDRLPGMGILKKIIYY